ncbi:hypothetical protein RAS12_29175 [Achromobacter seleniivolatilans]|uniref:Uncharacterized protein n=1 Tax=Achromobacter seleniivolatilans TaxID=3047478 RepID=A0ABY9M0T5_9BURK|nr:hypothetical protein [Achromobacter sp. R39]WMD20619.1 hypothetical protein RAS12_29175 [Achromobacter sp. R39]
MEALNAEEFDAPAAPVWEKGQAANNKTTANLTKSTRMFNRAKEWMNDGYIMSCHQAICPAIHSLTSAN